MDKKPVGLTKDMSWQVGARRKVKSSAEGLWELITSQEGSRIWLGELPEFTFAKDAKFTLADGTKGTITTYVPGSHLRMTWHPAHFTRASILQVRIIPHPAGTILAFHQESLPDAVAREERKVFFLDKLEKLALLLNY